MSTPETPKAVPWSFDQVINRLNTRWDLQLPGLQGSVATLAENEGAIARRIASRIHFLCFRTQLNLEGLIDDFEDKPKQVKSNWVFKPQQEAGTLPRLPNDKSRLFKESLTSPVRLTSSQRTDLLDYLDKLVDDEYRLSRDSVTYQRSSGDGCNKESGRDTTTRERNSTPTRTPDFALSAAPFAWDIVDAGMMDESCTVTVQNRKKRSPSRDGIEVFGNS
jgi:hypothetical protein